MILEITEKDMLANVNKHEIVINRDEYQDLKNQIKILKKELKIITKLEAELKTLKSKID